jgi:ATP-dependent helicase/nuclease subunit A
VTVARQIPDAARIPQVAASDPEHSVFVSANAGSGKTHVLVQRVINLLLRGADPAKILCVTVHQGRRSQHGDARIQYARGVDCAR